MNSSTKRILKVWLPSVIWLALIVTESTDLGSSEHTGRILYPIFHYLFGMSPHRFGVIHVVLRKTGHFVGYATLSVLLFRSWRATFPRLSTRWCLQWAMLGFVCTVLVSVLDEFHQSFLPSRTSTFRDVVLDSCAALVAQLVLFMILRRRNTGIEGASVRR
ncbi:MAG: VanZ family protein [Terriglobales bacterium]